MAEALVSAVMEQIVSILTQQAEEGIRLIMGADAEVQKLKRNFSAIQSLLEDAESKQVKEKAVRDWLEKLRDVSYDIDDVLDEWNTVIQKLRVKEVENASKSLRKVCSLLPCYGFCCRSVLRYDIVIKIKNLNGRLDVIAEEKDRFNFNPTDGTQNLERLITTSDIDVSEVFGRDDEKDALLNLLLSESSQGPSIPIVSIVGMGGIGKTTLAQFAYNDDKVKAHFNEKIWVCVSEPFDQIRIAKAILESLKNEAPNLNELETIMRNIRQSIQGKKFLLVLDDVWTEDPNDWEQLKNALQCGSSGSKILVTTRKESVANVIKTNHMIGVKTLPEKESWKLFSHLAFFDRSMEECEELQYIGEKIVNRCKGLPLAVRTLGSLLRFKKEIKEWQSVLDSEMWEVEEVEKGLFPPLLLSYFDLPSILKKCFLYWAIFPKDYEIGKHELIKLWMSQGYLKTKSSEDEELVGEKYFKILAMRSFFQDFKKDDFDVDIVSCKMHDIVHDCAQFLTKNECFTLELDDSKEILLESYENARHSFIISKRQIQLPTYIYKMKRMHTIVVKFDFNLVDYINLPNLFNQLTCLRTLDLSGDSIKDIPRGIGKLIHLRYFNISDNPMIKELPETLCDLYNLQILNIEWCPLLENLPQGMGKLINLRCLFLDETSISYMPKGVERLTHLQRLQYFVGGDTGYGNKVCKLECLKNFNHLKSLGIKRLGNLTDVDNLRRAELNNKGKLLELYLNFEGTVYEDHEVLLESVQPSINLETLGIEEHRGKTIFPNWLMSLTKLRVLRLNNCINCEHLPPLGKLPSLEALYIRQLESIRRVGNEFLGIESSSSSSSASSVIAFRKLKLLMLEFLNELEEWDYGITETGSEQSVKIMPCIRTLRIYSCPKLKSLPSHLLPITKSNNFYIYECPLLEQYLDGERQPLSPSSLQD